MKIKPKYLNTLTGYLNWIPKDNSLFLRPTFSYDPNGFAAAEVMMAWETFGKALPESSSEPDLLSQYVQGKKSRDFHVDNWRTDCKKGESGFHMAYPEEFLYTLGLDEKEFRSVFGRSPDPMILLEFQMVNEFMRLTENTTDELLCFCRRAMLLYMRKAINTSK